MKSILTQRGVVPLGLASREEIKRYEDLLRLTYRMYRCETVDQGARLLYESLGPELMGLFPSGANDFGAMKKDFLR